MSHRDHCTANTCCLDVAAVDVDPHAPDVRVLAGYVLGLNDPPGTYAPPGDFYALLIRTFFQADLSNRARLSLGFPMLGSMVRAYKDDFDGLGRLRIAAATGEWDG